MKDLFIFPLLVFCAAASNNEEGRKFIIGERAEISLGFPVSSWERVVNGQKQIMIRCTPVVHEEDCHKWVDEVGNRVAWGVYIRPNGQLVIKKAIKADEGEYSSPDDPRDPSVVISIAVFPRIRNASFIYLRCSSRLRHGGSHAISRQGRSEDRNSSSARTQQNTIDQTMERPRKSDVAAQLSRMSLLEAGLMRREILSQGAIIKEDGTLFIEKVPCAKKEIIHSKTLVRN
ncbi:hypothetical protein PFISCL1PPCAC_24581 [Pristionchus fissidentatus]|uniref:ZP domain-containing protein n=1 Tax=Pristionchus fissidentatus TaxID=1538716 RepID=A0AAV5WRF2_9BILA|nr:hypothetical protein PFISCL1PPCAC_24581 [Pristionchus fissidentatus]